MLVVRDKFNGVIEVWGKILMYLLGFQVFSNNLAFKSWIQASC